MQNVFLRYLSSTVNAITVLIACNVWNGVWWQQRWFA